MYKGIYAGNKYAGGMPEMGIGVEYYFIHQPLTQSSIVDKQEAVFYDCPVKSPYRTHDEWLYNECLKSPDFVVYFFCPRGPDPSMLKIIRKRLKVPVIGVLGDTNGEHSYRINQAMADWCDLVVAMDAPYKQDPNTKTFVFPVCSETYYDDGRVRDIDISFLGRNREERTVFIEALKKEGLDIFTAGEETHQIKQPEYADLMRRSKITLNFPLVSESLPDSYQRKGRTVEAARCGTAIAEEKNPLSNLYFIPDKEYIVLDRKDPKKSADILRYYLEHDKERQEIANRGKEKATNLHSADNFWRDVLKEVEISG